MINTNEEIQQSDDEALFEGLVQRYGCGVAQEIIDQIKKAKSSSDAPDYMVVKAVIDMVELFRGEAQAKAKELRKSRRNLPKRISNVPNLEQCRLEKEFRHIYRLWWATMKLSYPFHRKAMQEAQKPRYGYRSTLVQSMAA